MKLTIAAAVLLGTIALSACIDETPAVPDLAASQRRMDVAAGASIVGDIGPGASYQIVVPPVWNGDLVLYAHGYVDPAGSEPLTDAERAMLPLLPALGYAVALSSYSENGFAVKDGAQRTKQLRGIFAASVGDPARTFLVGSSLGALVGLDLAERFPEHYDGLLALCGMVGGSQAQIDYVANVRVLFDALYPGALPGDLFDNPALTPPQVAALVGAAVTGNPANLGILASVMAQTFGTPIPGSNAAEVLTSVITALTFDVRGFGDVLDRTHGHFAFDNSDVSYVGSPDNATLNAAVDRFEATPDARNYLAKYYEPTGVFKLPVVTLHNPLDPAVPAFHEGLLAASASAAGYGAELEQRTAATIYGHCVFGVGELVAAFGALVAKAG